MEESSLLGEILSQERSTVLQNSLLVNVFLLREDEQATSIEALLALARLSDRLNRYLRTEHSSYPWMQGGEGPVFGIHVEQDKIPHLRAQCRYGVAVADEWALVRFMIQFTRDNNNNSEDEDEIVVECWDEDDGQVILIEAAHVLPSWVDDIGPSACRHRCWIQRGRIVLLAPSTTTTGAAAAGSATADTNLTRTQALQLLQSHSLACQRIVSIDNAIQRRIDSIFANPLTHTAAVALPLAAAHLLGKHPELLSVATSAWEDSVQSSRHMAPSSLPSGELPEALTEGWQWTVQTFGRLAYAQSRTLATAQGDWNTPDVIPRRYQQSPSIRRLRVQAQNHATPHLQHGVALGVRVVAGLEMLLQKSASQPHAPPRMFTSESEERILNYWVQIDSAMSRRQGDWLRQAWAAGPQQAQHSLEHIIKCPVYFPEVYNQPYPLSYPMKSVSHILQSALRSPSDEPFGAAVAPGRAEVDMDDTWLTVSEEAHLSHQQADNTGDTGEMQQVLDGFQSFMAGESQYEGVENGSIIQEDGRAESVPLASKANGCLNIRPAAFLHLLRETLMAPTAKDLENYLQRPPQARDQYFSEEDYTLMEPDSEADADKDMVALMEQMDEELKETNATVSRSVDSVDGGIIQDEGVAEEAHILSNLVESVDVSAGGPGPVRNILEGLGAKGDTTEDKTPQT